MLENQWNDNYVSHNGKSYLKAKAFCEKYGLSKDIVYVWMYHGNKHIYKIGKEVTIDEKALLRRREFYYKVWNETIDNYYGITEHISENKLATLLQRYFGGKVTAWGVYLNTTMFRISWQEKPIASYKIPMELWTIWRFTTFLIRRIERLWQ
jgi:hypothetical protein